MRRFACHYLYVSADGCYSKYVVELERRSDYYFSDVWAGDLFRREVC